MTRRRVNKRRSKVGSIAEFGVTFGILICIAIVLCDLGSVVVRYLITQGTIDNMTNKMSLAKTRSKAYDIVKHDKKAHATIQSIGVDIKAMNINIVVLEGDSDKLVFKEHESIPGNYLPHKAKSATYIIEVDYKAAIPSYLLGNKVRLNMKSQANWENLYKDPVTRDYYINL